MMAICGEATGGDCIYEPLNCDDGDACTDDQCDPAVGCVNLAVPDGCGACTDAAGNTYLPGEQLPSQDGCNWCECMSDGEIACEFTASCACEVACFDGNECTLDSCDPAGNCVYEPNDGAFCDDCDGVCSGGECGPSPFDILCSADADCDDGNPCPWDTCSCDAQCGVMCQCLHEVDPACGG
ncbi:MAG: hypothetical protein ACI9OJ_001767 [Myxococcota bacterium]|jgi:hypothetical protein